MIINVLDQKIKDMKELQRLENLKNNQEHQKLTDEKYRNLVENIHQIVLIVDFLEKNLKIEQEENLKYNILELLNELNVVNESALVDKEKILLSETKLKKINAEFKGKWPKKYLELTNAKVSTLKVISDIDAENVSVCLKDIQIAKTWNTDVAVFQTMMKGLKSADQLITNLGLNQEIIFFLQKMNQGKATLLDLNDDVLKWIKKENLKSKIKISFRTEKQI